LDTHKKPGMAFLPSWSFQPCSYVTLMGKKVIWKPFFVFQSFFSSASAADGEKERTTFRRKSFH
jgi:hypothetical protein